MANHPTTAPRRGAPARHTTDRLGELPPTLTVEQAGEMLGISRRSAYRAVARGDLPTLRLGRRILVPTPRLLALLGAGDVETADGGDAPPHDRLPAQRGAGSAAVSPGFPAQ